MIEFICDICKKKKSKEETRTITIHRRQRNVYIKYPVLNPNRKKLGTRLICLDCLKDKLNYEEK